MCPTVPTVSATATVHAALMQICIYVKIIWTETVLADINNASSYDIDDVSSGQQVTSLDAESTTSGAESAGDSVTIAEVAAAVADDDDDDDDVIMASLLCVGAAVCITSLGVLVFLAARRRLRAADDKRVVVPVSATQRLLAVAAAAAGPTAADDATIQQSSYHLPQPTTARTLYGDKWTASHVTSMRLLITGHHQHDSWADTCFVWRHVTLSVIITAIITFSCKAYFRYI